MGSIITWFPTAYYGFIFLALTLDEAVKYAQLFEQQARELWVLGEAFAAKWEKRLHDAEGAFVSKSDD